GLMMRQLADQGLSAKFMSGDGIVSNELASIAGDAVAGTLMTFAPDPRNQPDAKALVEKFRAAGFEPEAYTLYSYAALQVMASAATAAKSNDSQAVAAAIKANGPHKTAIGELGYDAKGDITRPDYVMYEWKKGADGNYTYIQMGM
ncbi:MAG: ABC transporter substrate-binding protein, partial [Notoacmeibacter sp.]